MSKLGLTFAGLFLAILGYFIATEGLFGESFIALILGLPWVLIPAYFEFWGASGAVGAVLTLVPIAINAAILYFLGSALGRIFSR